MEPNATGFTALERDVVQALLAGANRSLVVLRAQWEAASVSSREFTGVGFYTNFALPPAAPRFAELDVRIGDVLADIVGLRHGAGFILWVKGGTLSFLEGYSFGEQWPDDVGSYAVRYERDDRRLPPELV